MVLIFYKGGLEVAKFTPIRNWIFKSLISALHWNCFNQKFGILIEDLYFSHLIWTMNKQGFQFLRSFLSKTLSPTLQKLQHLSRGGRGEKLIQKSFHLPYTYL